MITGTILDRMSDEDARKLVRVDVRMVARPGTTPATAGAEVELPAKD